MDVQLAATGALGYMEAADRVTTGL